MLKELPGQYGKNVGTTGVKVYVCGVCGYEYVGDPDAEPEDHACPENAKGGRIIPAACEGSFCGISGNGRFRSDVLRIGDRHRRHDDGTGNRD